MRVEPDAIAAARAIGSGEMSLVIAGGVESMSRAPFVVGKSDAARAGLKLEDTTLGCGSSTGRCAGMAPTRCRKQPSTSPRNGAYRGQIRTRSLIAANSAAAAAAGGRLAEEIVPVTLQQRKGTVAVSVDEHPRADTTSALAAPAGR